MNNTKQTRFASDLNEKKIKTAALFFISFKALRCASFVIFSLIFSLIESEENAELPNSLSLSLNLKISCVFLSKKINQARVQITIKSEGYSNIFYLIVISQIIFCSCLSISWVISQDHDVDIILIILINQSTNFQLKLFNKLLVLQNFHFA